MNIYIYSLDSCPIQLILKNSSVFEEFLVSTFDKLSWQNFPWLNAWNLKLIMKSESIRQMITREKLEFTFMSYNLLQVLNEPVITVSNVIAIPVPQYFENLVKFKTFEQLADFETLFGLFHFKMLKSRHDYFQSRHIFKYLIETGQELPEELSENTRALLKIDFPFLKI